MPEPKFDVTPEKRATQRAMLARQLFRQPPLVTRRQVDLEGKTAIITGASTGIGLECAQQLLDLGLSRLILAVRSEPRGEDAKKQLLVNRNPDKQTVEVWLLDVASYNSIITFTERAKKLDRLDIFINNAGLTKRAFELNQKTHHEETMQVNYLSLALLVILFLPILKEKNSPDHPGRIVIVNSDVASWPKFKEQDSIPLLAAYDKPEGFDTQEWYYMSKLLGQLFISELVKRVPATVAIINAPNPGLCRTGLQREFDGSIVGFVFNILKGLLGRPAAIGARSLTDASVNHGRESHGQYLEDGKIQP